LVGIARRSFANPKMADLALFLLPHKRGGFVFALARAQA
jgi:hypothetical protein